MSIPTDTEYNNRYHNTEGVSDRVDGRVGYSEDHTDVVTEPVMHDNREADGQVEFYTLKPHQVEAISKMKNGCVLAGGVGVGKTFTALAYYAQIVCEGLLDRSKPMSKPKKLVVITTAKKRNSLDWQSEAIHLGIFPDPELSYSGKEFIVDSWNNIGKYVNVEDAFFIFDEQRLVGSGAWVKAFLKIAKHNEWILLSATPADTWMDYLPVFMANGFYRTRTDFIENHVVWQMMGGKYRKIRGFYGVKHLRRLRDQILVEMPYERHTTRHVVTVEVEHDVELFDRVWKDRWNIYEERPLVDSGEMHRIARRLVNSDPSRRWEIKKLVDKHPRLIIYYNFDYELEFLRTLHTELDIVVAEYNGHRHEDVPETDRWLYLVQYTAGHDAWNCIATNAIYYHSLHYSHRVFEQTQGRIDRLNTPFDDLYYYVAVSNSKIDKKIWRDVQAKRDFHEGRLIKY